MATMMECGHAANGTTKVDGVDVPCCVICGMGRGDTKHLTPMETQPDLTGRRSRCAYFKESLGRCPTTRHSRSGDQPGDYPSETDSSTSLPFFEHRPDRQFDRHFCGCWGWD